MKERVDRLVGMVAEDVDVVLVDVLVANLEEPRASGGVNRALSSL